MSKTRQVEIFSAGCPVCDDAVTLVQDLACDSCEVSILDMNDPATAQRAEQLGIQALPAVVVDGTLAACCSGEGVTENALRAEGIGQPIT